MTIGGTKQETDCWEIDSGNVVEEFTGSIDDLRIYRRALSATEIAALL